MLKLSLDHLPFPFADNFTISFVDYYYYKMFIAERMIYPTNQVSAHCYWPLDYLLYIYFLLNFLGVLINSNSYEKLTYIGYNTQ